MLIWITNLKKYIVRVQNLYSLYRNYADLFYNLFDVHSIIILGVFQLTNHKTIRELIK